MGIRYIFDNFLPGGHRDWNDWQRRGACQYSDDPCVDFRHRETRIMTTLMTSSVYDLPVDDKLKLLVLLCNQILMLQTTRDQIEEAFDRYEIKYLTIQF